MSIEPKELSAGQLDNYALIGMMASVADGVAQVKHETVRTMVQHFLGHIAFQEQQLADSLPGDLARELVEALKDILHSAYDPTRTDEEYRKVIAAAEAHLDGDERGSPETPQSKHSYLVHPGQFLREVLKKRGITWEGFAGLCSVPPGPHTWTSQIRAIIEARAPITLTFANVFERVLGVPAFLWLHCQDHYTKEHLDGSKGKEKDDG